MNDEKLQRIFANDVKIDKYNLENDCEIHPSLYQYWSETLAEKRLDRDLAADELTRIKAEKNLHYRLNPLEGQKTTEASIDSMVSVDPDVVAAKQKVAILERDVATLDGNVRALEHRKASLDNLRHLLIAGFYTTTTGRIDSMQDSVRASLNKKGE